MGSFLPLLMIRTWGSITGSFSILLITETDQFILIICSRFIFRYLVIRRAVRNIYLEYESYSLIPGIKFFARAKYVGYKAYPFYGYNGNESIYHHEWEDPDDPAYKTRMFYRIEKKYLRVSADLQDTIGESKFQWHGRLGNGVLQDRTCKY